MLRWSGVPLARSSPRAVRPRAASATVAGPRPRISPACAEACTREVDGRCRIVVVVRPRSSREGIEERHGGVLVVRVRPAPEGGKANARLLEVLAHTLGIPRRQLALVRGEAARHKELVVQGLCLAEVRARLAG